MKEAKDSEQIVKARGDITQAIKTPEDARAIMRTILNTWPAVENTQVTEAVITTTMSRVENELKPPRKKPATPAKKPTTPAKATKPTETPDKNKDTPTAAATPKGILKSGTRKSPRRRSGHTEK